MQHERDKSDFGQIQTALELYYNDNGEYPEVCSAGTCNTTGGVFPSVQYRSELGLFLESDPLNFLVKEGYLPSLPEIPASAGELAYVYYRGDAVNFKQGCGNNAVANNRTSYLLIAAPLQPDNSLDFPHESTRRYQSLSGDQRYSVPGSYCVLAGGFPYSQDLSE